MKRFLKRHKDELATTIGIIGGVSAILSSNKILYPEIMGTISGIAYVFLGAIANYGSDKQ